MGRKSLIYCGSRVPLKYSRYKVTLSTVQTGEHIVQSYGSSRNPATMLWKPLKRLRLNAVALHRCMRRAFVSAPGHDSRSPYAPEKMY